eukprot:s865_g21.t1
MRPSLRQQIPDAWHQESGGLSVRHRQLGVRQNQPVDSNITTMAIESPRPAPRFGGDGYDEVAELRSAVQREAPAVKLRLRAPFVEDAPEEYAGVKAEQVLFTNGSDQGIDLVVRCCCEKGSEVIIPSPTFAMFEQAAESEGLVIRRPNFTKETPGSVRDPEAVLEMVNPKTSLIVLSNPNNPTGTEIPRDAIMEVLKKCSCAILVDENEVETYPNLFVSRTFSKTWGFPSLRLGYLLSTGSNVSALTCVRGPYETWQPSTSLKGVRMEEM